MRLSGRVRVAVGMRRGFSGAPSAARAASLDASPVRLVMEGDVAVIHMNDPHSAMNTGNAAFMAALPPLWEQVEADPAVRAVVFYSDKPGVFFAGADIGMLSRCQTAAEASALSAAGQRLVKRIRDSDKLSVAAVNGACLGLGTELALACHYRVATAAQKTVFGLPEVQLGLLPGAGGCQLLPRLIGLPEALGMALTGTQVRASKAKKVGLVDVLVEPLGPGLGSTEENTARYLRVVALETARKLLAGGGVRAIRRKPWPLVTKFLTNTAAGRWILVEKASRDIERNTRGNYPAPPAILSVMMAGMKGGMAQGFAAEQSHFGRLAMTPESKALISIFFATQSLKKNRFGSPKTECKTVGVVGAGLMGAGIADVSLNKAGLAVILKDATPEGLARGEAQISGNLDKMVKKKALSPLEKELRLARLATGVHYDGFKSADVVIEAVFENLELKQRIVAELEHVVPPHCVIATNTSALPIASVAQKALRPENVVGMHYFSPVEKMPLLEVITHKGTSKEAAAQAVQVGLRQGKTVIVVGDGPGFYTTRILMPFVSEAFALLARGISPHHIDSVMKSGGFPVGPITLTDEVGLDVGLHIAKYLKSVFPERFAGNELAALEDFVAAGFTGRKAGKGFFLYPSEQEKKKQTGILDKVTKTLTGKSGQKELNAAAMVIVARHRSGGNEGESVHVADRDIFFRLVARMANEATECLREGVLNSASDGDIGAVFGLGFPPFLGGPFRWLDSVGADTVVRRLEGLAKEEGPQWGPSPLLLDMARTGKKFHDKHQ